MNIWLVLALALLAFFFIQENQVFFAFLCIVAIVFMLATEKPKAHATMTVAGPQGAPYVVQTRGGKVPGKYRIRIQKDWAARSMWEEFGMNMVGPFLESVGGTIFKIFTGGHAESEKEQVEAPKGR